MLLQNTAITKVIPKEECDTLYVHCKLQRHTGYVDFKSAAEDVAIIENKTLAGSL